MKNLLLTGLTLLSLALATATSATAESLEPKFNKLLTPEEPKSAPIPPAPTDNGSTQINCPQPIPGESARPCSGSWGTSPKARKRAEEINRSMGR